MESTTGDFPSASTLDFGRSELVKYGEKSSCGFMKFNYGKGYRVFLNAVGKKDVFLRSESFSSSQKDLKNELVNSAGAQILPYIRIGELISDHNRRLF